jgi:hypothetical protein
VLPPSLGIRRKPGKIVCDGSFFCGEMRESPALVGEASLIGRGVCVRQRQDGGPRPAPETAVMGAPIGGGCTNFHASDIARRTLALKAIMNEFVYWNQKRVFQRAILVALFSKSIY